MNSENLNLSVQFRLYMQRALWGMITPDMRAIAIGWSDERVWARFIYDHPVVEVDWEIIREVETSVIADLEEGVDVRFKAEFLAQGKLSHLPDEKWWAYVRREVQ
jgi:hypothetical protein